MDTIKYSFIDAPIPPPYHRSYDITITSAVVHLQIKSYHKVLFERNYPFSIVEFDILKTKAKYLEKPRQRNSGATGIKNYKIDLEKDDEVLYSLQWDSMLNDDIEQNTWDFIALLESKVPNIRKLIKESIGSR